MSLGSSERHLLLSGGADLRRLVRSCQFCRMTYACTRSWNALKPQVTAVDPTTRLLHIYGNQDRGCLVLLRNRELLVALQGATAPADLLSASDVLRVAIIDGLGSAHWGFQAETRRLEQRVMRDVVAATQQHDAERVTFIGHSMGGAIAALVALGFAKRLSSQNTGGARLQVGCHAFGTPRFCDGRLVDSILDALPEVRVIHLASDGVPLLPMRPGFVHLPHTLIATAAAASDAQPSLLSTILAAGADPHKLRSGHSCDAYLRTLQALADDVGLKEK